MFEGVGMRVIRAIVVVVATTGIAGAQAFAGSVIETVSAWNGSDLFSGFGDLNFGGLFVNVRGQTFRTPDALHTRLDSATFYVGKVAGTLPLEFNVSIMAWGGSTPIGSFLYESPRLTSSSGGLEPITVKPYLDLSPGTDYIAFLTALPYMDGNLSAGWVGTVPNNPYSSGAYYTLDRVQQVSHYLNPPTGYQWTSLGTSNSDMAFSMTFNDPAPETFGAGLLYLMAMTIRR